MSGMSKETKTDGPALRVHPNRAGGGATYTAEQLRAFAAKRRREAEAAARLGGAASSSPSASASDKAALSHWTSCAKVIGEAKKDRLGGSILPASSLDEHPDRVVPPRLGGSVAGGVLIDGVHHSDAELLFGTAEPTKEQMYAQIAAMNKRRGGFGYVDPAESLARSVEVARARLAGRAADDPLGIRDPKDVRPGSFAEMQLLTPDPVPVPMPMSVPMPVMGGGGDWNEDVPMPVMGGGGGWNEDVSASASRIGAGAGSRTKSKSKSQSKSKWAETNMEEVQAAAMSARAERKRMANRHAGVARLLRETSELLATNQRKKTTKHVKAKLNLTHVGGVASAVAADPPHPLHRDYPVMTADAARARGFAVPMPLPAPRKN
jgi:hypothetical protein